MNVNIVKILIPIIASFLFACSSQAEMMKVIDQNNNVMKQFLWLASSDDRVDENIDKAIDQGDPFAATSLAFKDFYVRKNLEDTRKRIDAIIAHWNLYETHKLTYRYAYGKLGVGWWSGMEAMMFPMLLVAYSQEENKKKYIDLANNMLDRMLLSPKDGGVMWREGGGCWLSEYAWEGMSQQDEYYVLNGNLLALQALKMSADALGRSDLNDSYNCVLAGTKARSNNFLNKDSQWPLYMLNPPTVNPVHYLIFEAIQFSSLYELTGESFYAEQLADRRRVFEQRYPVYSVGKGWGDQILFSMVGPPHPYILDTYPIKIICDSPLGEFKQFDHHNKKRDLSDRFFVESKFKFSDKTSCSVTAHYYGSNFLLYQTDDFKKTSRLLNPEKIRYEVDASLDAYMADKQKVIVDPARVSSDEYDYLNTQGRINFRFDPLIFSTDSFLGFELRPNKSLSVAISLSNGSKSFFRYYPKLESNKKNIILLSKIGFDNGLDIDSVRSATIFIYTDKENEKIEVDIGDVLLFDNQSYLFNYFKNNNIYMYTE